MFEIIAKVNDLSSINSNSSFSHLCISKKCNIGKEVLIKYYNNINQQEGTFTISNSIMSIGSVSSIMLYVENTDKTYNVYRYNGELIINRKIVDNTRKEKLVNIDDVIENLKNFLKE